MRATVHVFTFKEGFLARLAHDLRLTVGSFEMRLERGAVQAFFAADSLRVDGVALRGGVDGSALSADDKGDIEDTIRRELLRSAAHPRIEVRGALKTGDSGCYVDAEVHVRGVAKQLQIPVSFGAERATAEVEFAPSRFGIAPYKALAGAIRLRDRVLVRVEFLEESAKLQAAMQSGETCLFEPA